MTTWRFEKPLLDIRWDQHNHVRRMDVLVFLQFLLPASIWGTFESSYTSYDLVAGSLVPMCLTLVRAGDPNTQASNQSQHSQAQIHRSLIVTNLSDLRSPRLSLAF